MHILHIIINTASASLNVLGALTANLGILFIYLKGLTRLCLENVINANKSLVFVEFGSPVTNCLLPKPGIQ